MATKKFATASPYTFDNSFPPEDYIYTEYLNNVTTNFKSRSVAHPLVGALFGVGRAGTIHIASLATNPRVHLKYIVDDHTHRFDDLKKYWNLSDDVTFLTCNQADKVYEDKSVNVVFIASPTNTHFDIIMKSIAADKDIFSEKPITQSIEDTRKCYAAAKAKGRALFAAFNHRFDPAYRSVKQRVRSGEVGHVQIIKIVARDSPIPSTEFMKTSGGMFHDCMVHDIDMICWVLGELPCRVQASAAALIPEVKAVGDFDTVCSMLTFPSGTIALGDASRYSAYGYDQRLEVFGGKGMIKVENERPLPSVESYIGHEGIRYNPIYYTFPSRYRDSYRIELEHFLDVIQDGVPMDVNSWQTYAVSKIVTALEKSARTNSVVELDWSKDDIPAEYS